MGERKVLNKYFPPDFDPAKIPRRKQMKNAQMKVRMMLPMSIRCGTCGNYIYKGTKFNSRKEDAVGETYLGIQIYRFYFKCTKCSAEITYKTDPQNSDYTVESGASRNFEPWRNEDEAVGDQKRKREEEEMGDAMKSLENKALDSKQDMDILAALEEMRSMKSRHATVSVDDMLGTLMRSAQQQKEQNVTGELDEEDEELIKSIVFRNSKDYVKRIDDSLLDDDYEIKAAPSSSKGPSGEKATDTLTKASIDDDDISKSSTSKAGPSFLMPKFIVKPKDPAQTSKKPRVEKENENKPTALMSICANYDSDESD